MTLRGYDAWLTREPGYAVDPFDDPFDDPEHLEQRTVTCPKCGTTAEVDGYVDYGEVPDDSPAFVFRCSWPECDGAERSVHAGYPSRRPPRPLGVLDRVCPTCGARPGRACVKISASARSWSVGPEGEMDGLPKKHPHAER